MMTGRTIAELQAQITMSEVEVWLAYRRKYGPMNPNRTFDAGPAIIASLISKAHGGKAVPADFMPYYPKEEKEVTLNDLVQSFGSGVKIGKRG